MKTQPGITIGFIGLGAMGQPMVRQLVAAGHQLTVFDIDPSSVNAIANELNVTAASSVSGLATESGLVITMLPNADIVRQVVMDAEGVAESLAAGSTVIDMSSSYPVATQKLGKELSGRNVSLLDAPVSGGVRKARTGELAIMLGGDDEAALAAAQPVLQSMGSINRTGKLGSAHALKALNNYVSAAGLAAASEALIAGKAFGLDPNVMIDVINQSTGRNVATEFKMKQYVIPEDYRSAQFAMSLMAKDVSAAAQLGEELDLSLPGLSQARQLWADASSSLGNEADHTEIFRYLQSRVEAEEI